MKPLFKSEKLQKEFDEAGFVKVPLLNAAQVQSLVEGYATVAAKHEAIGIPYITTSHSNDAALIKQVDDMLQQVLAPQLDTVLQNHKLLFGNFLVKMPVPNSQTDPHQDITFVDETEYVSVNVWIALQDVSVENGCMYFMPGSHKLIPTIRPTHDYKWAYELVKQDVKKHSQVFEAKAGDAFIFHHAVVHGSFANKTSTPRLSAVIAAYSADAPLIHYYLPDINSNVLQKYGMHKEAYLHFVKQQPPAKGVYIKDVEFDFKQLNAHEFNQLAKQQRSKVSLLSRLTSWFSRKKVSAYE